MVERRNTIPILSNVLLRGDGAGLRLMATDLDLEVTETIAAEVAQAGATTVPAHILYDIVRKLPEGARSSSRRPPKRPDADPLRPLALQPVGPARDDFPEIAEGELPHRFALPPADLAPHRQDPVRDLDRGDALLSERHLLPHHRGGGD